MKQKLMAALFVSVSFLAVCRAEVDEFAEFDEPTPASSKSTAPTGKVALPTKQSTPLAGSPSAASSAIDLFNKGEYAKVTALIWGRIEKSTRADLLLLARSHEKRNEPDQMIKALNILIAKDAKDYEAYYYLGNAALMKNKAPEALENFKSVIEINPKYEPAYLGLINLYEKKKNLYELRILYQDMIASLGAKPNYLLKLCEINTQDGVFQAAIANCKEAISKNAKLADAYVFLGLSYKGAGETELSDKTLKQAANQFPQSESAQSAYAKTLEDQKNYVEALNYYKRASGVNKDSATAWLGIGSSAFELQKFDVALVGFKKACQIDKKNVVPLRRATNQLRLNKNSEWTGKFETASEQCSS